MGKIYNIPSMPEKSLMDAVNKTIDSTPLDFRQMQCIYKTEPKIKPFYAKQGYKVVKVKKMEWLIGNNECWKGSSIEAETFSGENFELNNNYEWIDDKHIFFQDVRNKNKKYMRAVFCTGTGKEEVYLVYKNNVLVSKPYSEILETKYLNPPERPKGIDYIRDLKVSSIIAIDTKDPISKYI